MRTKSPRILQSLIVATVALAATSALAQSDAQKAFNSIKNLPGSWEGKTQTGEPVQVNFKVTAGGSAVMSEILGKADMITMFHLDGPDKLLMTH